MSGVNLNGAKMLMYWDFDKSDDEQREINNCFYGGILTWGRKEKRESE